MNNNFEAQFQGNSTKMQIVDFLIDCGSYVSQVRSGEELLIYKNKDPLLWIFSLENNDLYEQNEFKDEYQNIELVDFLNDPLQYLTIVEKENDLFVFEGKTPF